MDNKDGVSAETVKEVKQYTWFNPKLREASYAAGDIYSDDVVKRAQQNWEIDSNDRPYLTHIKSLSATWPHLRLLADFMEVSTSPIRWNDFFTQKRTQKERDERASRTNVTRLDYVESGKIVVQDYRSIAGFRSALNEELNVDDAKRNFRLYVVEDLSRDVIEALGSHFDIEPAFFREHIFDYTWYNTRDRWVDPPQLSVTRKKQRWLQMRFATARYFKTAGDFKKAFQEAESFNVLRRPEDDLNNSVFDDKWAKVGLSRTRASLWLNSADANEGAVGILLVDPTIKEGRPLWYGYRNWEETPSMHSAAAPRSPPRESLYADFIYWAQKPEAFQSSPQHTDPASNIHVPIQALLYLICSEWLTMSEYIRTRLGQIEWEISFPDHFLNKGSNIDIALRKLHIWRRLVPLYREMVNETLERVFQFPCHNSSLTLVNGGAGAGTILGAGANVTIINNPPATGSHPANPSQPPTDSVSDPTQSASAAASTPPPSHCPCPVHISTAQKDGPINSMREDYTRLLSTLEEFQQRIDRLTSVVTAIISIDDSRRGQADNRNVTRLTWLATFFIPLSFVTGLFSMTSDIGTLGPTMKWYFATALPLASVSLGLAFILALPSVQHFGGLIRARFTEKKRVRDRSKG